MRQASPASRRRFLQGAVVLGALLPFDSLWATGCVAPVSNILGPAYRKGAPFRTRLCAAHEPGTPLTMSGRITDAATCKPLADAVLDVWQVNAAGDYDMESPGFHLRGKMRSAAGGRYAFDTIMPVPYGNRPKHIHYLITRAGYEPRITQVYFEGDERNATDRYVKKELIIATTEHAGAAKRPGARAGTLDIALDREQPPEADAEHTYREYAGIYEIVPGVNITVIAERRKLRWKLSAPENDGDATEGEFQPRAKGRFFVSEYDLEVTFVRNEHGVIDHTLDSLGLHKKIG